MIVCDRCRLREHFDCAGVIGSTPSRPYICKQCHGKNAANSNISSRLRSQSRRVPSGDASGSKPPSHIGSKVSSMASSNRSSIMKAQLELIEEEAKMKQKEIEEEEELKKLEHEEAQRQLEEKRKQMEEQKKLAEEESLLRQRKLEADKARMLKQQLIRRESLEKKNEVILQISERGSVVESTTNSREKVANWLAVNLPHGTPERNTLGKLNNPQADLVSSALNEASPIDVPGGTEIPSTAQPPREVSVEARHPPPPSPSGLPIVCSAANLNLPQASYRAGCQEIRSSTVREPFQQFVTASRPLLAITPVVHPDAPAFNHSCTSNDVGYDRHQPIRHRHVPAWTTSVQYDAVPNPSAAHQSPQPRPVRHDMFTEPVQHFPESAANHSPAPRPMNLLEHIEQPGALSSQQIAARQVVGKDLPPFGGNPADWPMFISSFEQSTVACGYSNAENLVRLQRCLTGHARDAVRCRLLLPANVPQVINTLRTLYGRPELLIRSLHETIRRTPGPRHDRPESILEFGLAVQNFVDHLQAANQEEHLANPMLMQELVEKLPGPMRMDWATFKNLQPRATVLTFGKFMGKLVTAASEVSFELPGFQKELNSEKQQRLREKARIQAHATESAPSLKSTTESTRKPPKTCRICEREGHRVAECSEFKHLNMEDRWKEVHDKGLCRTCLNNHGKWPCKSWQWCGFAGCRLKHHTLLHSSSAPVTSTHSMNVSSGSSLGGHTLFRVLPVVLYGNGKSLTVFAFIDEGSQITMLEEKVAKELDLSGPRKPLTLQWTGNVKRNELRSEEVSLKISGKCSANRYDLHQARTVSSLLLPAQRFNYQEMAMRFPHLKGLPIEDHDVVQPKLLIGLDNLRLGVPLKLREGGPFDPIAAKCRLGWGVYGRTSTEPVARASVNFHTSAASSSDDLLNEQLRDFFTLENSGAVNTNEKLESDEEKRARKLLENTTKRTALGFETGLLWKIDEPSFPETYPMAIRRMKALEKKFCCNPSMMQRIYEQLCDFEQKGYVRKVSESEVAAIDHRKTWFLPLGVVINPKKPGKMRLIWDAAAKVAGVSFNSYLLKGPDLLTPLPRVLSGFRLFPIAVSGDIREMFLQIKLQASDRNAQMFVFRRNPDEAVQVYAIEVTMFGSTCSPSSAQFVKNANAEQYAQHYPRAAAAIKEHHYVDDYLDSFRTIDEAVRVVNDVKFVHSKGGFEIRNFLSNEDEVLRRTGEIEPDSSKDFALVRSETTESVLGMKWIPADDIFTYTFSIRDDLKPILDENHVPTKREVLKVVMSLFDPLGFVSFFLVHGKVLMQDVWASGIG
ncbi:uncharacterized protein LOC134284458 [Aedes albopictus]|uniref:Peptidase A2 domain-containing protein n=1 Tax=Aedes albopictus TaxID=7160 RepID=A0ABM1ZCG7_AEDAL